MLTATPQPLRRQLPFQGRLGKPPLKGLAGVAVLDGVQLLNAKLRRRIAPEGFPAVRRIPFGMHQGEFARDFIKTRVLTAPLSRCGGSSALHETAVRRRGRLHPLNLSGALSRNKETGGHL